MLRLPHPTTLSFGLQSQYDLDVATDKLGDWLEQEVKESSKVN
ncbi:MAG: hypothetical protein NUV74_17960 [Candidatus Brocadiaceae bacterium]|nr:hypothetical protein [Candidatus Brocadiaceae bacterium]